MLKVINLCKQYKNSSIFALDNVSFQTEETGLIFILGESGSGKTTLLNIIGSLDIGSSGNVYFNDLDIQKFSHKEKEEYRNNQVGFIFQEHNLFSHLNVRDNILFSEVIQSKEKDLKRYEEVINLLDLQGLDKRYPHELSTGQKQRVAIARALIKNSRLILADEPTGSLDYENATNVLGYLKDISKNTLVIVVSHNKEFALTYADRIIQLDKGKIVSDKVISNNNEIVITDKYEPFKSKSRLPFKTISKYIFSNIKTKIFSTFLLVTLISIVISILVVLTFIVRYDNIKFLLKNMEINKDNIVSIGYIYRLDKYTSISPGQKKENIIELETMFPNYDFFPVYKFFNNLYYKNSNNEKFNYQINGIMEIDEDILNNLDFELIAGKLPEKNNDYIEIAISKYIYETFKYKYLELNEGYIYIDSFQSILDKTFKEDYISYKIVGIIDTKYDFEKAVYSNSLDMIIIREVHNALFTYTGYCDEVLLGNETDMFKIINKRKDYYTIKRDYNYIFIYYIKKLTNENVIFKDGYSSDTLSVDDIVVTSSLFDEIYYAQGYINILISNKVYEFAQTNFSMIKDDFEKDHGDSHYIHYQYYILNNKENKYQPEYNFDYFVKNVISNILLENDKYEVEIFESKGSISIDKKLNIVGIIYDDINEEYLYVSESLYDELYEFNDGEINYTITKIDFSKDNTKLMKFIYPHLENYVLYNGIRESTDIVNQMFNDLSKIYNYCWVISVILTIIIVFYISKSILKNEKQKIGLLFALGVKKNDIRRLLVFEFIFILLLSLPISSTLIYILSSIINNFIKTRYCVVANAIIYNPFIIILITLIIMMISFFIYLKSLFKYTRISTISIIKNND